MVIDGLFLRPFLSFVWSEAPAVARMPDSVRASRPSAHSSAAGENTQRRPVGGITGSHLSCEKTLSLWPTPGLWGGIFYLKKKIKFKDKWSKHIWCGFMVPRACIVRELRNNVKCRDCWRLIKLSSCHFSPERQPIERQVEEVLVAGVWGVSR